MSISKKTVLGDIISINPEVVPLLAQAGLHCIGCHVSAYESLEDGCKSHGLNDKEIDELVKNANVRIEEYNNLEKISFTKNAIFELQNRIKKAKVNFVRIVPKFSGEFDFEVAKEKNSGEIEIKKQVIILIEPRIERMLRGVEIDFDKKIKDFSAKRVPKNKLIKVKNKKK